VTHGVTISDVVSVTEVMIIIDNALIFDVFLSFIEIVFGIYFCFCCDYQNGCLDTALTTNGVAAVVSPVIVVVNGTYNV
jgi:hypothetical protein